LIAAESSRDARAEPKQSALLLEPEQRSDAEHDGMQNEEESVKPVLQRQASLGVYQLVLGHK
jgi:hypothetical protein